MPINIKYSLTDLKKGIEKYFQRTRRKIFLEYILMAGINDSRQDADDLISYIKSIDSNKLLHVNLIRYNATSRDLRPTSTDGTHKFRDYLLRHRINVTIRKSLGEDIQGACGQLAGGKL